MNPISISLMELKQFSKTKQIIRVSSVLTEVIDDYSGGNDENPLLSELPPKKFTQDDSFQSVDGSSWISHLLHFLSDWLFSKEDFVLSKEIEIDIWNDWEWVLSKTEELSLKQSVLDVKKVGEELDNLRNRGFTLRYRSHFKQIAKDYFQTLSGEDLTFLSTPLDSSKNSKIISDVVNTLQSEWLTTIKEIFFSDPKTEEKWKSFAENYQEKPYQRNVVGSLKELAFTSSQGNADAGINEHVLTDVLWSFWKTLVEIFRQDLDLNLNEIKLALLADAISQAKVIFITLWIQTVKNSKIGRKNEGKVVQRWIQKEKKEKQRLEQIKNHGTDAKYQYNPTRISEEERTKDLKKIKELLSKQLQFQR